MGVFETIQFENPHNWTEQPKAGQSTTATVWTIATRMIGKMIGRLIKVK